MVHAGSLPGLGIAGKLRQTRISRVLVMLASSALAMAAQPAAAQMITGPQDCAGAVVDRQSFAAALQIVQVFLPPDEADAMMKQVLGNIVDLIKNGFGPESPDPQLQALLDKEMSSIPEVLLPVVSKHMPSLSNGMACAYVHEFSAAELAELLAFARTPTGHHYFSRSTALLSDPSVLAANRAYVADIRPVAEAFSQRVRKDVTEYKRQKQNKR